MFDEQMDTETLERWLRDCKYLAQHPHMQFRMVNASEPNGEWYAQRALELEDVLAKRRAAEHPG